MDKSKKDWSKYDPLSTITTFVTLYHKPECLKISRAIANINCLFFLIQVIYILGDYQARCSFRMLKFLCFNLCMYIPPLINNATAEELMETTSRFKYTNLTKEFISEHARKAILKDGRLACFIFKLAFITGFTHAFLVIPVVILNEEESLILAVADAYLSYIKVPFIVMYCLFMLFTEFGFVLCLIQLMYVILQVRFRVRILAEKVRYVSETLKDFSPLVIGKNWKDQDNIRGGLKKIIQEHGKVLMIMKIMFRHYGIYCVPFSFGCLSYVIAVIINKNNETNGVWAIIYFSNFAFNCMLMSFVCPMYGQLSEDEWENLYSVICEMPWYNLTVENRKLYLMLLLNAQRKVECCIISSVAVNYNYWLKMLRTVYGAANVYYNSHKK